MITHVLPVAVQRGKKTVVVVSGQQNFAGVYKALFEGEGVSARVIPSAKKTPLVRSVTLELTVEANAAPGVREFRLASSLGVSSIGQLVVSEHPVIQEIGDNNTREKANLISLPCMVAGRIEAAEDVDYFKFHAKAGQTVTFEVLCARLQDKIHDLQKHADPILTLYDNAGRELAANDDFYFADPMLSYTFKQDGDYFIQVRDSKYDGDPRWVYALLATDQPYASHVFPMAVNPGKTVELAPIGSASLVKPTIRFTTPESVGLHAVVLDTGTGKTNPVPLIVSDLPQFNEVEPNDTPAQATRVHIPCGINGKIGAPRDLDHFVFSAKKGKAIRFEVKARRFGTLLQSSLDSVLDVLNSKGRTLASNDDAFGKDAAILFTPPADGDYVLAHSRPEQQGRSNLGVSHRGRLVQTGLHAEVRRRQGDDRPGIANGLVRATQPDGRLHRAGEDRRERSAARGDGERPHHPARPDAGLAGSERGGGCTHRSEQRRAYRHGQRDL